MPRPRAAVAAALAALLLVACGPATEVPDATTSEPHGGAPPTASPADGRAASNTAAAATPRAPATPPPASTATCETVLRSGTPAVFVCIDEPREGQRVAGSVRFTGQAGITLRGDLVLTLVDANGNSVLLLDLPRPREGGAAPWGVTVAVPLSAALGPARLRLYIADSTGESATAEIGVVIAPPGPR